MSVARVNQEATRRMWQRQEEHALSIGRLCIVWAVLDRAVDDLFEPLLECSDAQVASVITNVENISARCDILKRLLTISSPSPAYRKWLTALLNRVSGELAPLRNRYVHDTWSITHESVTKIDKRAKIAKPQSRAEDQLVFDSQEATPTENLEKLRERVTLVMVMLSFAKLDLQRWRQTGQPLEPHPQYIPASKPNARYLTAQEHFEALQRGQTPSHYEFDVFE